MILYILWVGVIIWMMVLTWIVIKTQNHYFRLVKKTGRESIDGILESIIQKEEMHGTELKMIKKALQEVIGQSKFYLQKIGIVRFHPFEKSGGEESFVIALVNKESTGLVMNFIYTREGLRVYTKRVKQAKGEEYTLTQEEKEAITHAQ